MIEDTTFSIRIEQVHGCGQLHEYTITMKKDELFSYVLSNEVKDFLPDLDVLAGFPNFLISPARPKITLVGHYDSVVIEGIEMWGHQMRCMGCKQDLLFSDE